MWPFRRRRPEPTGVLRLGETPGTDEGYSVYVVGETRFPDTYASLLAEASDDERAAGRLHRWAALVRITDPAFPQTAEVAVEFDGRRGGYLRPPHVDEAAARVAEANVVALEVPALVEVAPSGFVVRLALRSVSGN